MRIVLASGSQSRASLMRSAGIEADIMPPRVDEAAAKAGMRAEGLSVADQAMRLAELKAVKVSDQAPGALVIGGDQMMSCDGAAFDKSATLAEGAATLKRLQGRAHTLETAIVVAESGRVVWRHLARPKLTMRALSDEEIARYLETVGEDVLSSVGVYKLEGYGVRLFSRIEGDFFSILGLPVLPLLDYFYTRGAIRL